MNILWFVSSLEQKGGGERFVLEATNALRSVGHDVHVVCDRLSSEAGFDGRYDLSGVFCTDHDFDRSADYVGRAFNKLRGTIVLNRIIRQLRPDLVFCQSEFDAIKLYLLSGLLHFRYRVFVFGQMYQFKTDITRYSSTFRHHLETIVLSRPGYSETVTMPPPSLPFTTWLLNELVSYLKFRAIRAADHVFAVSKQVQWEVSLVYGRSSTICRAAFDEQYIDVQAINHPRPLSSPMQLLSVSRLVEKKRIDLTIAAFSVSHIDAKLTVIGTGPEEMQLKELARQSPRSTDIVFLGSVDDATLQREISAADCLISMDIGDYDISVIEAMGKGLRVLVPTDFDMTDFSNEFGGCVSVYPEVAALAAAIDAIPQMPPPTPANLPVLKCLTWQSLARTCIAGMT